MAWRCVSSRLLVSSSRRPLPWAPRSSSCSALITARSARLPGSGMISGLSASSRLRLVARSSESGTRVCALPAYTTMAVCASCRASSRSSSLRLAWARRLGEASLASISGVSSSSTTSGSAGLGFCCSMRCQLGPSSANSARSQARPRASQGRRLLRPPVAVSSADWNAAGSNACQRPLRFSRCQSCQSKKPNSGISSSQKGRCQWGQRLVSSLMTVSPVAVSAEYASVVAGLARVFG